MSAEFLPALLSIIVINLVVSGDNAVVIGMAAHRLPPQQRRLAILSNLRGYYPGLYDSH